MAAVIENSLFKSIYSKINGSIISIENVPINVSCCSFISNSCEKFGGSICALSATIYINKTSFSKCFSKANTNGVVGNAIFIYKNLVALSDISTFQCGPPDQHSDSSIGVDCCKVTTINYNASSNYGTGGSAGIRYKEPADGSFVKYMQVYDGNDDLAIENQKNFYIVYYSNFIYLRNIDYIYWGDTANIIEFRNCVFWDCNTKSFSNNVAFVATNCISNSYDNINKTSSAIMNKISINTLCSLKIRLTISRCRNTFFSKIAYYMLVCYS